MKYKSVLFLVSYLHNEKVYFLHSSLQNKFFLKLFYIDGSLIEFCSPKLFFNIHFPNN